jgi:hypothetical protein
MERHGVWVDCPINPDWRAANDRRELSQLQRGLTVLCGCLRDAHALEYLDDMWCLVDWDGKCVLKEKSLHELVKKAGIAE